MPEAPYRIETRVRYDAATIVLHWLTAILVVVLWVSAHAIDWFGHGTPAMLIRSAHISLGVLLGLILTARFAWRLGPGRALPAAESGVVGLLGRLTHLALYALVTAAVVLGLATWLGRGGALWGVIAVPKFDLSALGDRHQIKGWHELAANAILILAGLHAAAALFHHYVWRDGVLRRMLPAGRG